MSKKDRWNRKIFSWCRNESMDDAETTICHCQAKHSRSRRRQPESLTTDSCQFKRGLITV